jgi:5-oxoprolinase (ATP-hydrolysing) subunit A
MTPIDLNADLGEAFGAWSMGDDDALLDVVTSANIACGFHAGDPSTIRRTVAAAVARGVVIGAHVSYPDLVGFGRRQLDMAPDDLAAAVTYQIGALDGFCRAAGTAVRYVKAHGALYHRIASDPTAAEAFVGACHDYDATLMLLGQPIGATAEPARRAGLTVIAEGFADRAYRDDGTLLPRSEPGAVHHDVDVIVRQAIELAAAGVVRSICVHGDTPSAVSAARRICAGLAATHALRPFV